jgi:hypothetical protein
MTELAREHHDSLQLQDINPNQSQTTRADNIKKITTANLPRLPNSTKAKLATKILPEEIAVALSSTANRKAADLDGITYEVYKNIRTRNKNLVKEGREGFHVTKMLMLLFNDIAENGLNEGSEINAGWLCPIYKKNDKLDIANYCPITVLNTDYKLMAKTLQAKLASAAPNVIHQNQAGFMKGRSIFDHIKTIQAVTEYAEAIDDPDWNGLIVALDQEKAYDKIRHDYLWNVLEAMNIPMRFINTVKEMYKGAKTQVMINGFLSKPFEVTHGVRQGDPLSCLLFNLAIEPLAHTIQNSSLEGLKIPKLHEKLKALMFADDTTVFLSNKDSYDTLMGIIDDWCEAAGAKFNENKTEIIPFGSLEYKSFVRRTRKTYEDANPIPDSIKINSDGELTRILGAWFGDNEPTQPWATVIDKTTMKLHEWKKSNPTIEGTCLINWMENMSSSQFLTKAQGMPPYIMDRFEKISKELTWDSLKARIKMDMMTLLVRLGGRRLPNIKTRNLAIDITDLQVFLDQENKRIWTYLLEDNMRKAWDENLHMQADDPRIKPMIQAWPPAKSKRKLTKMARKILETAKKTNLRIEVDKVSEDLKHQMPIWYHPALKPGEKRDNNSRKSKHLRRKHCITTVGDAVELAILAEHDARRTGNSCPCKQCSQIETDADCISPNDCIQHAKKLINKIDENWRPKIKLTISLPHTTRNLYLPNSGTINNRHPKKATIIEKKSKTSSINDII